MKSFLSQVADQTAEFDPLKTLFVFPTRRACIAFRKELLELNSGKVFIPAILPVAEFLEKVSSFPVAHELVLLCELYDAYLESGGQETFEVFSQWGEQLLADFDDIDANLADASKVFSRIAELKAIDFAFAPSEDEINQANNFWNEFSKIPLTPLRENFLEYWQMLPFIYSNFQNRLYAKRLSTKGMAWKSAALHIQNHPYIQGIDRIVFAGFYAFTKSEEKLLSGLSELNKLLLFKDADTWYADETNREAGDFFRKGLLKADDIPFTGNNLITSQKMVSLIQAPGKNAMANVLVSKVAAMVELKEHCTVVLPDESLLFPFLAACESKGIITNVSAGFPLSRHPFFSLLSAVKKLRNAIQEEHSPDAINYLVDDIINHPLLTYEALHGNHDTLVGALAAKTLTCESEEQLLRLLITVAAQNKIHDSVIPVRPYIEEQLLNVIALIKPYYFRLSPSSWWNLVERYSGVIRIPFEPGEECDVDVLGFLETRVIDYRNILIASVNEGILPSHSSGNSLIPYAIRKLFKLPCREENESVTAYHFFRLLQRTSNITLISNSDTDDFGKGEPSRYILQIVHELAHDNNQIQIHQENISCSVNPPLNEGITIHKSEEVLSKLRKRFAEKNSYGFSASALSMYINCQLKFYLNYVAGLNYREEQKSIDPAVFGTILHETLRRLYKDDLNLSEELLDELIENIDVSLTAAIEDTIKLKELSGNNLLMKGVLRELVKRAIDADKYDLPKTIRGVEKKFTSELEIDSIGSVILNARIDRIDEKYGITRIIDYKTGKDELKENGSIEEMFTNPDRKAAFQLMFYAWLYYQENQLPVAAGLSKLRRLSEGIQFLNQGMPLEHQQFDEYTSELKKLIAEIFNPHVPFGQTSTLANCRFCDYKAFCGRFN